MDGSDFDTLVKALATTPLSRANVLRGLAAGAASLTGVRLLGAEPGAAKNNNEKKIRICVCQNSDVATCKGQKKEKKKAKTILRRNPCAYKGKCQGVSGCAAGTDPLSPPPPGGPPPGSSPPCTSDGDCATSAFCQAGTCVPCNFPCATGQRCVHGTCTCDPFGNTCPNEVDGQCTCAAFVSSPVQAGCTDRNSTCDLDKPCDINDDCPVGSVCLLGCADPPATNPRRCSKPCIPV